MSEPVATLIVDSNPGGDLASEMVFRVDGDLPNARWVTDDDSWTDRRTHIRPLRINDRVFLATEKNSRRPSDDYYAPFATATIAQIWTEYHYPEVWTVTVENVEEL